MNNYNYHEAVLEAVLTAIRDQYTADEISEKMKDRDSFTDDLYDDLWVDDSVTGNASGSYWCSRYDAEEVLMHNLDLLAEVVEEFGGAMDLLKSGAEACDVAIRCYLLGGAIAEALDILSGEVIVNGSGKAFWLSQWEGIVGMMDDDLRDELHMKLAPCTEQEFFTAYAEAHEKKFDEVWEMDKQYPIF